jgi:hypothetical protein
MRHEGDRGVRDGKVRNNAVARRLRRCDVIAAHCSQAAVLAAQRDVMMQLRASPSGRKPHLSSPPEWRLFAAYGLAATLFLFADIQVAIAEPLKRAQHWEQVAQYSVEAESEALPIEGQESEARGTRNLGHRMVIMRADGGLTYFVGHPDRARDIDWKYEPFNLDIRLCQGRFIRHQPFSRMVEIAQFPVGSTIPDPIRFDVLFFFLPVWPLRTYAAPHSEPGAPPMILVVGAALNSKQYEITSERELVDHQWCRVVRSLVGNDRIWLTEEKGLCILRRRWYTDRSNAVAAELTTTKVREVSPGLWLPVEVQLEYRRADTKTGSVPFARTVTRVLRCEVDDTVPSEKWEVASRAGTIEKKESDFKQIVPGGHDLLMEMAKFYRDHLGLPHGSDRRTASTLTSSHLLLAMLAGLIIGGLGFKWVSSMRNVNRGRVLVDGEAYKSG